MADDVPKESVPYWFYKQFMKVSCMARASTFGFPDFCQPIEGPAARYEFASRIAYEFSAD